MKTKFAVLVLVLGFFVSLYGVDDSEIWAGRNTKSGAKRAYEFYKNASEQTNSYELDWKFARAAYHYADYFVKDRREKKKLFTEGKKSAEKAVVINGNDVEGHVYLGICLGSWAKANGVMASLRSVPLILKEANKSIAIQPDFSGAAPYILRANVYMKAPGIAGGNIHKAESDFRKALALAPDNRKIYRYLAQVLIRLRKRKEAKKLVEKGLSLTYDPQDKLVEDSEISKLQKLKKQLR